MATKLKVYKGSQHPHLAQQPKPLEFHASNAPKKPGMPKSGQPTHHHLEGQVA
jgi:large subunit ribosomal protein L13